jgi:hypothetical protein
MVRSSQGTGELDLPAMSQVDGEVAGTSRLPSVFPWYQEDQVRPGKWFRRLLWMPPVLRRAPIGEDEVCYQVAGPRKV